jgi:hypothetical protein
MGAYVGLRFFHLDDPARFPLVLRRGGAHPTPTDPADVCPTLTPRPTATPLPTAGGTGTATPDGTPTPPFAATATGTSSAAPTRSATASATASGTPAPLPTTPVAWCGGPGGPAILCPRTVGLVPRVVVDRALADPSRVDGWGQRRNPGVPFDAVHNPCRTCLTIRNPGVPFHPVFNGLTWSASCR